MCLATPSKVIKINGKKAYVQAGDHQHRVDLSLLKNIKVGDYLFIHEKMAINKIPESEAKKILKIVEDHACHCHNHNH